MDLATQPVLEACPHRFRPTDAKSQRGRKKELGSSTRRRKAGRTPWKVPEGPPRLPSCSQKTSR